MLPGRAVCVTFDDGYEDFAETAWPLLRRYGFGAHMFLVADLVGGVAEWDAAEGPPAPLMDWATIERLRREGVTFGCHTCSHPRLTRVGPERVAASCAARRTLLEDRLGAEMSSFAYPFGSVDSLARNAVDAAGFATAVTIREGSPATATTPSCCLGSRWRARPTSRLSSSRSGRRSPRHFSVVFVTPGRGGWGQPHDG